MKKKDHFRVIIEPSISTVHYYLSRFGPLRVLRTMPLCYTCSVNITSAASVKCVSCCKVWHTKCLKLSKEETEIINKDKLTWKCNKCVSDLRSPN